MAGRVFPGSNKGDPTFTFTDEHFTALVNDLEPRIKVQVDSYLTIRFLALKEQFDKALKEEHEDRTTSFKDDLHKMSVDLPALVERTVAKAMPFREPAILQDVTFPGGHSRLRSFLHQIKSALILHDKSFADDSAKINWVSRHFRPDTSSSHLWWMSLIHANAVRRRSRIRIRARGWTSSLPS